MLNTADKQQLSSSHTEEIVLIETEILGRLSSWRLKATSVSLLPLQGLRSSAESPSSSCILPPT